MAAPLPRPSRALTLAEGALDRIAASVALLGGLALVAIILVSVVSILGRSVIPLLARAFGVDVAPMGIPGDIEVVEHGTGVAVFAFLPYCQMRRGNVVVDFFTAGWPLRTRAVLDALANAVFFGLALLVARQLTAGLGEKIAYADTTMVLRLPVAYPFAAAVACAWLLVAVCAFGIWRSLEEIATGTEIGPRGAAEH